MQNHLLPPLALLALLITGVAPGAEPEPPNDAGATVTAFCSAISSRNLDKVLGFLAPGSVQFSLRPSHTGMGAEQSSVTTDLRGHWSMIGPVLFSATSAYSRKAEITDTRIDGDLATVWARVRTESVRTGQSSPSVDEFMEVYMLVRKDGTWKIGAVADNRQPNDIGINRSPQSSLQSD